MYVGYPALIRASSFCLFFCGFFFVFLFFVFFLFVFFFFLFVVVFLLLLFFFVVFFFFVFCFLTTEAVAIPGYRHDQRFSTGCLVWEQFDPSVRY